MAKNLRMKSSTLELVINTGPVIALVAATDSLAWLAKLYRDVWMPQAVYDELCASDSSTPEAALVDGAGHIIHRVPPSGELPPSLAHQIDQGEAWVIQTALMRNVTTVAIDEKAGRRVARLHGLKVTGSLGILIRAKKEGAIDNLEDAILRMRSRGIWLSDELTRQALSEVGEGDR